jgi:phosphoserine phosphatase RsbU/P
LEFRKNLLFRTHDEMGPSDEIDSTLRREIHLARNIQTKLLNGEKPTVSSGEVSGISIPARLIGGDYYDFYPLSNGNIRIIIGDVMGKGIPAAMLMILTRGAFRSAAESTKGPGDTLTAMNNALYKDLRKLGSFVTVFCADWDPKKGHFKYANAGHNLPIIIRENEHVELPPIKGVMLGGLSNQIYLENDIRLIESDLVFFYTDGIVEAQNRDGTQYRLERLIQVLKDSTALSASGIEEAVVQSVNQFTEGLPQRDDITMVALKIGKEISEISSFNSPAINM